MTKRVSHWKRYIQINRINFWGLTPLTACLWTLGGSQSTRRDPTQTRGDGGIEFRTFLLCHFSSKLFSYMRLFQFAKIAGSLTHRHNSITANVRRSIMKYKLGNIIIIITQIKVTKPFSRWPQWYFCPAGGGTELHVRGLSNSVSYVRLLVDVMCLYSLWLQRGLKGWWWCDVSRISLQEACKATRVLRGFFSL